MIKAICQSQYKQLISTATWYFYFNSQGFQQLKTVRMQYQSALKWSLAKVSATISGKTRLISPYILTGLASFLIFPHEIASSGLAPLSLPSNSLDVFKNTLKFAPFLIKLALQIWCLMRAYYFLNSSMINSSVSYKFDFPRIQYVLIFKSIIF